MDFPLMPPGLNGVAGLSAFRLVLFSLACSAAARVSVLERVWGAGGFDVPALRVLEPLAFLSRPSDNVYFVFLVHPSSR